MTSPWWDDDDELLATLADALREGTDVPRAFTETGIAAYAWHNVDAELAQLTYDSAAETVPSPSTTRAERAALRELTFASRHLRIHLQVSGRALYGQLIPPQEGDVELRRADGPPVVVAADKDGWFTIQPLPVASFRLHCQTVTGITALTDWLTV